MKKTFIAFVFSAFLLSWNAAADATRQFLAVSGNIDEIALLQPTPESMAQRETEWMTTELGLSDDQVSKVDAINVKYAEKMMEQFQGGPGGDREAMQEMMAEINAQKRTEFEEILSAEQLLKYDEYLANRPAGGRGGFGPPPGQ